MTFNQLLFPFVFLPVSILLFAVAPQRFKKLVLLLLSIVFIAWGNPGDLLLIGLSIVFNYASAMEIAWFRRRKQEKKAKTTLIVSVVMNVLMLGYFKYFNFAAENVNALLHTSISKNTMAAPIGISFFTFSVLSALFDIYRGKARPPQNPFDFALFVTFFPKLTVGPIIQYKDMMPQLNAATLTKEQLEGGLRVFVVGLSKKVLLANTLGLAFYAISDLPKTELSMATAWIGALAYTFMLYFDFSGFSDMATGLGKVFGFTLPQNFQYPYCSDSVADFWRRWHASLGAWFRDYVYIPLGGSREGNGRTMRNLMVVWLLTGIWHGANWTFVLWGLYHGLILILEKFVFAGVIERLPKAVRRVVAFLLVVFGWVFFFSPDIGSAFAFFGGMFNFTKLVDSTALYYLTNNAILFVLSIVGATPTVRNLALKLKKRGYGWFYVAGVAVFTVLFLFCVAGMVSDTYSSALYAQF